MNRRLTEAERAVLDAVYGLGQRWTQFDAVGKFDADAFNNYMDEREAAEREAMAEAHAEELEKSDG